MGWWMWVVAGILLLVGELLIPTGFFLLLIGVGSIITGLLVLVGAGGPVWFQWVLCAALSIALLLLVRGRMTGRRPQKSREGLVGEEVIIAESIAPGATGKGELRGAMWSVKNVGNSILANGERVIVDSVQNLTLHVRPAGSSKP